jgi:hypothetical protein
MKEESFDIIAKRQFKFLESDYNFKLIECRAEDWGYELKYLNSKTGIKITYEFREAYIFIMLYQLLEGKLIENTRNINYNTILFGYSLEDIINIRNPSVLIKPAYKYGDKSQFYNKEKGLKLYVSAFASNLKNYAKDVLSGNFEVFKELNKIVKERFKRYQ